MINNEDNLGPGSKDWEPWLKDNLEELLDEPKGSMLIRFTHSIISIGE